MVGPGRTLSLIGPTNNHSASTPHAPWFASYLELLISYRYFSDQNQLRYLCNQIRRYSQSAN
ncbi:hypothetical protein M378DRAFT_172338 [Amanita muscaria Koide BX008]|uniref:Uncharacterized protein n=1 Tax=Amanita muscaria (strain Koide BX008) TaxID=946122 RepID=A0A0C2WJG6_AMAMK|nr:hypothetical protein M378DRAFT_172338 [Amanita muscaria Koide BX008]